ncbi:MAG: hypothetical protein ACKVVP_21675 [Chloroflexota bacterium]
MKVRLTRMLRRLVLAGLLSIAINAWGQAVQAQEYPDFYGTVVAADRELGILVIQVDRGEDVLVHVDHLGEAPWIEGAFQLDNVVLLRTQRVGADYRAISWEEARNGRERFGG